MNFPAVKDPAWIDGQIDTELERTDEWINGFNLYYNNQSLPLNASEDTEEGYEYARKVETDELPTEADFVTAEGWF